MNLLILYTAKNRYEIFLKEVYSLGNICPCCGREYDFTDFLEKGEILERYCGNNKEKLYIIAPEPDGYDDKNHVISHGDL